MVPALLFVPLAHAFARIGFASSIKRLPLPRIEWVEARNEISQKTSVAPRYMGTGDMGGTGCAKSGTHLGASSCMVLRGGR